jgi:hypothetical protein
MPGFAVIDYYNNDYYGNDYYNNYYSKSAVY